MIYRSDFYKVEMALEKAVSFFKNRDAMNADVHVAEIRLSPITIQAEEALETLRSWKDWLDI